MPCKFNSPIPVELEEGQSYNWCSCGLSQNMPLCDGAHECTEKKPVSFSIEETNFSEKKQITLFLCACTKTDNPPFCDGSHFED